MRSLQVVNITDTAVCKWLESCFTWRAGELELEAGVLAAGLVQTSFLLFLSYLDCISSWRETCGCSEASLALFSAQYAEALRGFVDSDWAGCPDSRLSTCCYALMFN